MKTTVRKEDIEPNKLSLTRTIKKRDLNQYRDYLKRLEKDSLKNEPPVSSLEDLLTSCSLKSDDDNIKTILDKP